MTPHAAHSGGLGQPALSLPGPGQLILSASIRPAQLILSASIRPAQLILSASILPTQLIFMLSPVWPTPAHPLGLPDLARPADHLRSELVLSHPFDLPS